MNIILYLLQTIQYLYQQNCFLIQFICKYIPLKQWAFDDSHSPEYQKFKTDELPKIICHKQDWDWNDLLEYYAKRYNKVLKPVARRKECDIPEDCHCPSCNAPMPYLYRNNGKKGQILCKECIKHACQVADAYFPRTADNSSAPKSGTAWLFLDSKPEGIPAIPKGLALDST